MALEVKKKASEASHGKFSSFELLPKIVCKRHDAENISFHLELIKWEQSVRRKVEV